MEIISYVDIDKITLPESRLRERIPHNGIRELGDSIKEVGMLNPLVLRPVEGEVLMLVAGHRRLKAAKEIGMRRVPAVVIPMDDRGAEEFALVDNVQREPLADADLVRAYSRRRGRDSRMAFCRALGWHLCKIGEICRRVQLEAAGQTQSRTDYGSRIQLRGTGNIRMIDNTVRKTVEMIGATTQGITMLRSEDQGEVSYTIRVKKPI